MSAPLPPPAWLEQFESDFSAVLRTPLVPEIEVEDGRGRWRAREQAYGAAIAAAASGGRARLAIYNRQYWFRLFGVLHAEFPLTTLLAGAWRINQLGSRFLRGQPPVQPDLAAAVEGFDAFLAEVVPAEGLAPRPHAPPVPRRALLQAAAVDQAFREVFRAPPQAAFKPAAAELERARLLWSEAVRLIEEDWPLIELRRQARGTQEVAALPAPHAGGPRIWALCQVAGGQRLVALEPLQARLLRALQAAPLHAALAELEQACTPAERARLLEHTRRWLADSLRLGFWTGIAA